MAARRSSTEPEDYPDIGSDHVGSSTLNVLPSPPSTTKPMLEALGPEYAASASVSSWTLGVRWLETASAEQISVYRLVQRVASEVIAEGSPIGW